jgi:hypothetical protein
MIDGKFRQDAVFYTHGAGSEVVWDGDPDGQFYVLRNGEMRIHYSPHSDSTTVIRYTDQLEAIGVQTDEDLERFTELGEEMFTWVDNPWFEVVDDTDPSDDGEVYHTLDDAVERAIHLVQRHANADGVL